MAPHVSPHTGYRIQDTGYRIYGWKNLPYSTIFKPFWGLFNAEYIVQFVFSYTKTIVGTWRSTHIIFHLTIRASILFYRCNKWDYRFYPYQCAFFLVIFLRHFWRTKIINKAVVGNVTGNFYFYFFPKTHRLAVFGHFPRQKWTFERQKML